MSPRASFIYCTCSLLLFAILSYSAALTKSATFDEPAHISAAIVHLRDGDFRVEPDHPPLWKYWVALPLLFDLPDANTDSPIFRNTPHHVQSLFPWAAATLYQTPGNDPDAILARARFMMLLCGVALGAITSFFAYRAAGPLAACVAATLFALDPNFLAHAPLVKNDVALALGITTLAYLLYRTCDRITLPRLVAIAACCAACVTTKLTGLLAAPILLLTLTTRALLPTPWPLTLPSFIPQSAIHNPQLTSRPNRLLAATLITLACALFTYVSIWGVYRFRFNPVADDPTVHIDADQFLFRAAKGDLLNTLHRPTATAEEFNAWRPDRTLQLGRFALDHHLLPEAFLDGLIYAHAASIARPSYLLGTTHLTGHWYYFPLAFLVKTPLTTLFVLLFSAATATLSIRRPLSSFIIQHSAFLLSLSIPIIILLLTTLPAAVNLGLRHIFPLYPLLYVAAAVTLARLYPRRPKLLRPAFLLATLTLCLETLTAYPNFIPFFNCAAGGYRGGLHLLGDSNLDWGQDLPLLADWQKHHPNRSLYLAYFGLADPAYYGIRYHNLPHGYRFAPPPPDNTLPTTGVLAVSASTLQGIEFTNPADNPYAPLLLRQPTQILGGSIYLFDLGGD